MKKLIKFAFLILTISGFAQQGAIKTYFPKSDLGNTKSIPYKDTTVNAVTKIIPCYTAHYSCSASFQILIDSVAHSGANTLAGYAYLQSSIDSVNWITRDSVALIKAKDSSIIITEANFYSLYSRIKIVQTGSAKNRYGLAYCYKKPLTHEYMIQNRPFFKSDYLSVYTKPTKDSITIKNTAFGTLSMLNAGLYYGTLTAFYLVDTVASQTMSGFAYLKGSNNGTEWITIQKVGLSRADYEQSFSPVFAYFKFYRIDYTTSGTHKTRFGRAWIVNPNI
jgi:hypothetical protein